MPVTDQFPRPADSNHHCARHVGNSAGDTPNRVFERHRFGELLAYASRGTSLRPGDIIGSGTVGTGCILELSAVHGTQAYPWLQPGDTVHLEVEQLGVIECAIVPGPPVVPLR